MTRPQEPPPTDTSRDHYRRQIPKSMLKVLEAMDRGAHLKEDLEADTQGITCGGKVVRRNVLNGMRNRGLLKHDGGYPIRKYSKR